MAWFTIGTIDVEIQTSGPSVTYERIGPTFVTYGGGIRSQVRFNRKTWNGSTPPLTWTEADAIVAEVGLGMTTVGGEWPGATIPVYLEITNDVPIKDEREVTKDARRVLTIKAQEVQPT